MDLNGYVLGETDSPIELSSAADNHDVTLAMIRQARREIYLLSYDLDSMILDHEDIISALSDFARDNRFSHVHILLQTPEKAMRHGHRLVSLAQRLSSSIQIHQPGEEHRSVIESFIVVDGIGVIRRQFADRFEGIANFKAPIDARDMRAHFVSMWERSTPEIRLRRLQL
jgi:predicted DNA-binding protein with PD1-like motif